MSIHSTCHRHCSQDKCTNLKQLIVGARYIRDHEIKYIDQIFEAGLSQSTKRQVLLLFIYFFNTRNQSREILQLKSICFFWVSGKCPVEIKAWSYFSGGVPFWMRVCVCVCFLAKRKKALEQPRLSVPFKTGLKHKQGARGSLRLETLVCPFPGPT